MRRVRVHQAWYRAEVLGIERYGYLAGSGAPCGSVLPDDAAARHLNFLDDEAVHRYTERRSQGWGVDPVRCTKYLTSSQALSFNMLARAFTKPTECAELFNVLLGRTDLARRETSSFEFASQGTKYGLGDQTLLDVLLRFTTVTGSLQVVAVETKLADRFSTRRTMGMHGGKYADLARRSGAWLDLKASLAGNRTRQLARCHALAESVQEQEGDPSDHALLVVLTHPDDRSAADCVKTYMAGVATPGSVVHENWSRFLFAAERTGALEEAAAFELSRRYVDLACSDTAWQSLESSRRTANSRQGE
jgi:hypothetical protein